MILYFSGTGNSRHAAEKIAQTTGDAIENIAVHLREGTTGTYQSTVPYVFVGPVYAGRYPKVMTEFMEKSTFGGNKKAYFIATCAETPWITETYTRKLAAKIGFEVLGFNSVIMPQSYTTSGAAKPDEENQKIVAAAEPKIAEIAEMIQNGVNAAERSTWQIGHVQRHQPDDVHDHDEHEKIPYHSGLHRLRHLRIRMSAWQH